MPRLQWDVTIRYVGHVERWDAVKIEVRWMVVMQLSVSSGTERSEPWRPYHAIESASKQS